MQPVNICPWCGHTWTGPPLITCPQCGRRDDDDEGDADVIILTDLEDDETASLLAVLAALIPDNLELIVIDQRAR